MRPLSEMAEIMCPRCEWMTLQYDDGTFACIHCGAGWPRVETIEAVMWVWDEINRAYQRRIDALQQVAKTKGGGSSG
jgi:hypothetical protein